MTASTIPSRAASRSLTTGRPDIRGAIFHGLLLLCLLLSLSVLFVLLGDLLSRGLPVLADRGLDFLTSNTSTRFPQTGVAQGIIGSLLIAGFVAVVAFPIGIMTAIYLEEYAPDTRLTRVIAVNIRNLAGVPSVVYGLLGLAVFVALFQSLGVGTGRNVIAGGLTMAVLVLPIVVITSAEALRAVPQALREGGYGLGASRWEVTRKLVLPAAAPGILTGTVLSLSRALGETAPLILVGAIAGYYSSGNASALSQLTGSYTTLPMIIFGWARESRSDFRDLATPAAILILLAVTLLANTLAIVLRNRFERSI
jgi:phosphate transport system permease protein